MTTIKGCCGLCGDVILGVPDIEVHSCANAEIAWYLFSCPMCDRPVARSASPAVVDSLSAAGCLVVTWTWPAEWDEVHSGPRLRESDVKRFRAGMDAADGSAAMQAELARGTQHHDRG